jgi:NAD(P)-dependent dehydrogenase (short-subunit alcohol dehydrogenase family)
VTGTPLPGSIQVDLSGRVAVVTGGSRGLGRQMVLAFARCGADVVIASRKLANCEAVAAEVEALGRRALPVACNVSDWGQAESLAATALEHYGHVDVLVNNAGLSPLYPTVDDVTEALWDKVIGVNLKGPFRLAARLGTEMQRAATEGRRPGGSIINISSIAAIRQTADVVPYSAAKAGLNAMTVGLAHAFGPHVRVNCIQAGPFMTDITKAWDVPAFEENARRTMALQRGGQPEEVVGAALYFASDASSYCTGAVLRLDGGVP